MNRAGRDPFKVGAIVLAVIVVVTYLGFTKDIPFVNEPYQIKAALRDSSGIKPGSPVRIAGVEVGKVTDVRHTSAGARSAVITMSVKDDGRPVHTDARLKIRPRIFLEGNFFVDLEPGTSAAPEMKDGATIPVEHTANPVQLDQVLKALQADARADLQTTLDELGRTQAAGGAKALNDSLSYQPAAYKFSAIVSEALLGEQPHDLGDLVRDQGAVSAALDRDPAALRDLITNFNTTAGALAARQADLRTAVGELPRTLRAAMPALASLNAAFPSVRTFARAAIPGVRSSGPTIDAVLPLVRQLRGLVQPGELRGLSADLRGATPGLTKVAATSVPLLEQIRASGSCTSNVLVPAGNDKVSDPNFPATGPAYQELAKSFVGLAGESRSFDANGQWFKVLGEGGLETFTLGNGLFGTASGSFLGTNPPPQRDRPPLTPDVPCETQQPPDYRTHQGPAPARVRAANPEDPRAKARYAKARDVAIDLMRRTVQRSGDKKLKVIDRDVTMDEIRAIARRTGRLGQMLGLLKAEKQGKAYR